MPLFLFALGRAIDLVPLVRVDARAPLRPLELAESGTTVG
jgi:hypothetical protein